MNPPPAHGLHVDESSLSDTTSSGLENSLRSEMPSCPNQNTLEPIAIIGFSLRFPQDATSAESFWKMLIEGRCAMTKVPEDRWTLASFYHPDGKRSNSVRIKLLFLFFSVLQYQ